MAEVDNLIYCPECGQPDYLCGCGWAAYDEREREMRGECRPDSELDCARYQAMVDGEQHPERAYILSDLDIWFPNPFYSGPPVPHPDDYQPE